MCITLNLPLACKYADCKAVCDFICVDNSNVCSVTVCEIFAVEMCMISTLTFLNEPRSDVNTSVERPHATSYVLAIAMFVASVTVCEIMTCERTDVLSSNYWHWKWRKRTKTIWIKLSDERTLSNCICLQKLAPLDPAVCTQYITKHFVNDPRTNERTYCPLS